MASPTTPKALLFDIGGVCVLSPFQAILDYEIENRIPVGYINFAIQQGPSITGAWQRLERGEVKLNDGWFEEFRAQLSRTHVWALFVRRLQEKDVHQQQYPVQTGNESLPEMPCIDAARLFWRMMRISRTPDPWMYPALRRLKESRKFLIGALSNTIDFPKGILDDEGNPFSNALVHEPRSSDAQGESRSRNISNEFDVFISSAHVGLRKPDARVYAMALQRLSEMSEKAGGGALVAEDVLFLDDIGTNLKSARAYGLRTLKVNLGRTREAVEELERITGLGLVEKDSRL